MCEAVDWETKLAWALEEHARRSAGRGRPGEREDFRLAAVAGASWAAGLAAAMAGRDAESRELLRRAADGYVVSWDAAPAGSWGRPIAALRCRLMAGDHEGAERDAQRALAEGAAEGEGAIAAYCACLASFVLGDDARATTLAESLADDEAFQPAAVAAALVAIGRRDAPAYAAAARAVLADFEARDAFLEDMPVADTVLVLDALAEARRIPSAPLPSPLLSPGGDR
jgi:hypothetical protein